MALTVDQLLTPEISRPARYLGTEMGSVHKPWSDAEVRWCLTYPELYEVGASNLGHIILYNILNTQPRQLCDRSYLPAPDLAAKLRDTHTPLFAVESRRSLLEFDILGFSLSYELGATNILEMLDLAQIPLTHQERDRPGQSGKPYPLVFAGGQTATSNPEPYADFFDFIVLGDGEEVLPEIGLVVEEGKLRGLSREALLLDLAQVPGVYVPRFYGLQPDGTVQRQRSDVPATILRRVATPIPAYSIGLVPYVQTVHDRLTVEIRRGCTRGCRFCQPGMLTRPARDVDPDAVVDAITEGMRQTGYNEFSLLSLSCSDYLALPALGVELKNRLKDDNISLSLPSQRVDRFDEDIANIIGGTRQTGITFAPEAGTQRLRDIINKGLTNGELLRGVKTAYQQGWSKMKLYFMVGLPGETDEDVVGIAETVRWLRQECRGRKRLNFNITISNFTPKPHTPFQWHSVSTAEFERKHQLLKAEFRTMRGVKVNFTDVRISAMEDFVGRGDRRLATVVRRAWELGAGMDSWWENLNRAYSAWTTAIEEAGLEGKYRELEQGHLFWGNGEVGNEGIGNREVGSGGIESQDSLSSDSLNTDFLNTDFLNTDSLNTDSLATDALATLPLPWDHLDTGIDKRWLAEDLQRALAEATVPDCSFEGCSHCGVCGVDFGHNEVVPPPPIPEFTGHFQPNPNRVQRLRVRFGKQGDLRLLSHLDLLRLFDRAIRRAALPIAYSGGFHPMPRMIPASALSLGLTSEGELMDLELTEAIDPTLALQNLQAQFPPDVPIYGVEVVTPDSPPVTEAIQTATFRVQLAIVSRPGEEVEPSESNDSEDLEPSGSEPSPLEPLGLEPLEKLETVDQTIVQTWIDQLLAQSIVEVELTSKSGKVHRVNLRERLQTVVWLGSSDRHLATQHPLELPSIVLDYEGNYRNDGNLLRPEHLGMMLETIAQNPRIEIQLIHAHRLAIGL